MRRDVRRVLYGLALLSLATMGCSSSGTDKDVGTVDGTPEDTASGADSIADVSGDDSVGVADSTDTLFPEVSEEVEPSPDSSDAEVEPPVPEGHYEVAAFTVAHSCVGCNQVSICGGPPVSDNRGITVDAAPNVQTGVLFASERWERAGRVLPVGDCKIYRDEELEPVIHHPAGVETLDAGDLLFGGEMPMLAGEDLLLSYSNATHNYPSAYNPPQSQATWAEEYLPGTEVTLTGAGGADWGAFAVADEAPVDLDILSPHTDESGQIQSIPTDQSLTVTWSGADDYDEMVLYLEGFFCEGGVDGIEFLLLCHAENDGEFTIPQELLAELEWPMYVRLGLSISRKIPLGLAELEPQPAWSVRSWANVPVYHDPDAEQFDPFECESTEMALGFVGVPCADDGACGGGCCLPEYQVYYKDGYCSLTGCESDADCPEDAACAGDWWDFTPWESYCAKACASDDDCRLPEYACLPTPTGVNACTPNFW